MLGRVCRSRCVLSEFGVVGSTPVDTGVVASSIPSVSLVPSVSLAPPVPSVSSVTQVRSVSSLKASTIGPTPGATLDFMEPTHFVTGPRRFASTASEASPDTRDTSGQVKAESNVAMCFDIDGVIMRGKEALPGATEALLRLREHNVPFVLLTNGGGVMEREKAEAVSKATGVYIDPNQVAVCHSPLQHLVPDYKGKRVLVVGSSSVYDVAVEYGFNDVVTPNHLVHDDPRRYSFREFEHKPLDDHLDDKPVDAVFVMHDPIDWHVDLQVTLDAIRGGSPIGSGTSQAIPVIVCNPDLVYADRYEVPRLACGAFIECLDLLFERLTGDKLELTVFGKPERATYKFATALLERHGWTGSSCGANGSYIYMVGDNPHADMRGAIDADPAWKGILVHTGVFKPDDGEDNHPEHPGDFVVHGISEAVDHVLSSHFAQ